MKKILLLFPFLLLTACSTLSEESLTRYTQPFIHKLTQTEVLANNFCVFDTILQHTFSKPFMIQHGQRGTQPLPIDLNGINSGWDQRLQLFISPELIAKYFQQEFVYLAQQTDLPKILETQGKKLYIRIEEVPNDFYFIDKSQHKLIYFNEAKTEYDKRMRDYQEKEDAKNSISNITTGKKQLVVKYAFISQKERTSERTMILNPLEKLVMSNESWKKSITNYFKEYQINLVLEASKLLNEIMNNTK